MRHRGCLCPLLAWCALAILGCAGGRPRAAESDPRYAGPIRGDDVARGMNRYQVVCGPCHGDHRERRGPLLAGLGWSAPEIRHQIREGNALMPPIRPARLSDDDIEALLAYFVTIGTVIEEDSAEDEARFEEELERDLMAGETREAPDAGMAAPAEGSSEDASIDAGAIDAEPIDAEPIDAEPIDATIDAGAIDTAAPDAGG